MKSKKALKCILLIDDDQMTNLINRKIIEKTKLDVEITVVDSAYRALDFLTSSGDYAGKDYSYPGIILLDINMPGLTGWDFMDRYHRLDEEQKADIVVAMLTTSENPDDKEKAESTEGIDQFFTKPLTREKVLGLVKQFWPDQLPKEEVE